jgi:hypothetical protein
MRSLRSVLFVALLLAFAGCGGGGDGQTLDQLRTKLDKVPEYSVILADMNSKGLFTHDYFHRYMIVTVERKKDQPDAQPTVKQNATNWVRVNKETYDKYKPSLGMTILAKRQDGTIDMVPQPPAYQFVGDSRFGRWEKDNQGNQIWSWIATAALLSHFFDRVGTTSGPRGGPPVQYRDYEDYRSSSGKGLPYFGRKDSQGRTEYGTQGTVTEKSNPGFFERNQARMAERKDSFAGKVESRMGRSAPPSSSRSSGGGIGSSSRGRR